VSAIEELSQEEIEELLRASVVGRIGCHAEGATYVVPIIYAYEGGSVYVASIEGRKTRMMRQNPQVCFEVDERREGGGWRSVIADGTYVELDDMGSERALELLARRFGRVPDGRRRGGGDRPTVCFRIDLRGPTGRAVRRR
jgi:nitroimidazol reductase NimA-like FMN-containing flavoprotein (pyridoxamine 5'-phosphate oxidase superfamily)